MSFASFRPWIDSTRQLIAANVARVTPICAAAAAPLLLWTRPMNGDLHTTNVILSVIAAVAVLGALMVVAFAVGLLLVYRRWMTLAQQLLARVDHVVLHELPPVVTR